MIILILIFIYLVIDNKSENLDSTNLSNEAIQNIASIYAAKDTSVTFNNMRLTGTLNGKNINAVDISSNNINTTGSITFNGNLNIVNPSGNKFIINGIDFRDYVIGCTLSSVNTAVDKYKNGANGGSQHFTVGKWSFCDNADYGFNDVADNIIVNPGFGVVLWTNCNFNSDNNNTTEYAKIENRDVKPARCSFLNENSTRSIILETGDNTGAAANLYTKNSNLVKIENTSTKTFMNTVSCLEVYKL